MNRRSFLARLCAAPIVALTLLKAPLVSEPLGWLPSPAPVTGESLGISIRFIRQFDVQAAQHVTRFDVLYGVGNLAPELAARVTDRPWWSLRRWMAA